MDLILPFPLEGKGLLSVMRRFLLLNVLTSDNEKGKKPEVCQPISSNLV
jgi:hypothetical protein